MREQPAEDHGVGDVSDMKLVEAKQPSLRRKIIGDAPDRILTLILAKFHFLADRAQAFVHVKHEFVEMRTALAHDRTRFEEEIHQHGLAAADLAVDIEAFD